jgi:hypothetical protein
VKLSCFADTDSLYIDLSDEPSVESREISAGVVLDHNRRLSDCLQSGIPCERSLFAVQDARHA